MTVDVVVVNWNSGVQLQACVESVLAFGNGLTGKIIVVDNGSTDGSASAIEGFPDVTLIRAGENLGFGKACNLGAAQGESKFLLFLNPDACVFPDSLAKVIDFMQKSANAKIGICGVQLLDESGHISRSCTRFPSLLGFVSHALGLDRFFPHSGHAMAEWDHAQTREVDQVIGAFFLVRRAVFEAMDGFDERFFVYFEEVDFSRRVRNAGWRSVYIADAQAYHAGGGTSRQIKARRLFYSLRSRLLYAFKHFSWVGAMLVMFATLLVEPFSRTALALLRGSWSGLKETWVAYGMLLRWLPAWIFNNNTR